MEKNSLTCYGVLDLLSLAFIPPWKLEAPVSWEFCVSWCCGD